MKKNIVTYASIIVCVMVLFLSIGYSAFNSKLNITGTVANVRIKKDIRVTGISIYSTAGGGIANYEDYNVNNIQMGIVLPSSNSTLTYKVTVTNIGNTEMGIFNITGLPSNLDYEVTSYTMKTKICNTNNVCKLGISKDFYIKIKYKTYNSSKLSYTLVLNLDFQPMYIATYTDKSGTSHTSDVIGKDTYQLDFGSSKPSSLTVTMGGVITTAYTYTNGVLTIPNVSGNIVITPKYAITKPGSMWLMLTKERVATESYAALFGTKVDPYEVTYKHQLNSLTPSSTKNVWKVVNATQSSTITNSVPNLYCLRAGLGFSDLTKSILYSQVYLTDTTEYQKLQNYLYGSSSPGTDMTIFKQSEISNYNSVLWILDNMLLEKATESEVQNYLIKYAGYSSNDFEENAGTVLSRADIEAIQQLVVWYFTDADRSDYHSESLFTLYVMMESDSSNFFILDSQKNKYISYSDLLNNPIHGQIGSKRQKYAAKLYSSLISSAKSASSSTSGLYQSSRDIFIYLAATNAHNEQPVAMVR